MDFFYLFIIAGLIGYIVFLHMKMVRKNIFIESTLKKLTEIEKVWKVDELLNFQEDIKKMNYYSSYFNDKLLEDESLSFVFENASKSKIYIHYTKEEADVKSILSNGFRFVDSFYKTALPVFEDKLDLIMKHNSRKYFGDYMVLICISNKIIDSYSSELDKAGIKNYFIENILTEALPFKNENSDLVFLLPEQFIKGYINHKTGEIVKNPHFNPEYISPGFKVNIEKMKESDLEKINDI
jgi:hypothetical protein